MPKPETTPPVTNTNFVDMPLTLPFHAHSFSRKPNCTPRADKQKTNFMRGTVHHEYRQMPLRMKFCASFPVAPKGRGNGAFSFFVMQKHNKKHRRTDFAAESPSLFRDVRPRSAVCLFGCRVAASAANRCPKRFQKILFQCSTGLGKCQRPSDGKTGRIRRAIPTGFLWISAKAGRGNSAPGLWKSHGAP